MPARFYTISDLPSLFRFKVTLNFTISKLTETKIKIMRGIQVLIFFVLFSINLLAQEKQGTSNDSPGKVWGYAFGDYFVKIGGKISEGFSGEYSNYRKDFNAFDFRRIYLGYDHGISKSFDARFALSYEGKEVSANKNITVFIKDAWLKWKNVFDKTNLSIGIMPTPGFSYISEKFWEYRSIEKTLLDFRQLESSRDMGIMLDGTFGKKDQSGYYIMIGNGSGTKLETNNDSKNLYGEIYTNLSNNNLLLDLFIGIDENLPLIKTFFGYKFSNTKIGLEFAKSDFTDPWDDNAFGTSVFLISKTGKKEKLFFRYDYFQPRKNSLGPKEHFVVAGFDYNPHEKVHIMPNIWMNFYQKTNRSIAKKTDIVPRLTFFYEYR